MQKEAHLRQMAERAPGGGSKRDRLESGGEMTRGQGRGRPGICWGGGGGRSGPQGGSDPPPGPVHLPSGLRLGSDPGADHPCSGPRQSWVTFVCSPRAGDISEPQRLPRKRLLKEEGRVGGAHMEQAAREPQFKLPWWPALSIPPASPIPQEGPGRGEVGVMTPGGSRMKWGSWVPRRVQAKLGVMIPGGSRPRWGS